MILFVEGPRHSGKTFLINNFLESCNDPRLEYYKFYFANHVKTLGMVSDEKSPSLHYFSLGNIMTIMEMNQLPEHKDKIWVFDRAIVSAYTWAILRGRLAKPKAELEYFSLLSSDLFKNCKTLVVSVAGQTGDSGRTKDTWDGAHSTQEEQSQMAHLLEIGKPWLSNSESKNGLSIMVNHFDAKSATLFNNECYQLLGIEPNK